MDFSRQEYWSGVPFPTPGDLPNPGIEPMSLVSPALAGEFFITSTTWEAPKNHIVGDFISSIFYMVEPKGKDLSKFSESHTASKWYIQSLRPASATLKPVLLTTLEP